MREKGGAEKGEHVPTRTEHVPTRTAGVGWRGAAAGVSAAAGNGVRTARRGERVEECVRAGGAGDEKIIKICGGMFLLLLRGGARVCYHTLDYV